MALFLWALQWCERLGGVTMLKRLYSVLAVLALGGCTGTNFHRQLLTIDSHIDIPISLGLADADPRIDGPMQVDIPKMQAGGIDAGFFIVYVSQGPLSVAGYNAAYVAAKAKFTAIERMINHSDVMQRVQSPAELKQAVANGRLAVAIGVENAYPLGPDLRYLDEFYARGARYISLTHFGHNHVADSSLAKGEQQGVAEPVYAGLGDLGHALIARLNELGIMVDVSHASNAATLQAAQVSNTPIIASHSGVAALAPHHRNLSDEAIKAIANGGGVIQLVAYDHYLRTVSQEELARTGDIKAALGFSDSKSYSLATQTQLQALRLELQALDKQWPRASVATLVDHIDYVVRLVGIGHAGIASDFGGGGGVKDWDSADTSAAVTAELMARGYGADDIQKIWGGNLLRVWQAVEDHAMRLR